MACGGRALMGDPFLITGPAVISFSGGRTSAYMLWRILQAHGGTLRDDVLVCFTNTGREMPATLDFVRDCGEAWDVPIHWLEYRRGENSGTAYAVEVDYDTASRHGEPFAQILSGRPMLPNPIARFCTVELKVRTIRRWCVEHYGDDVVWAQVVGLRADEPKRVERMLDPARQKKAGKESRNVLLPLAAAGIDQMEVFRFWKAQPFDLRLKGAWEGNCDGCFLKNRAGLERMLLDYPERMEWWAAIERAKAGTTIAASGATFRADREDYATMARIVRDQGRLPFDLREATIPCDEAGCGV